MLRKTLTALVVLAALAALPATAETTLEEILATHVESRGGMDAIEAIRSMVIEGRVSQGPGMEMPIRMELARPNSMRMEFEFQGMKGIQAFDGETGWQVMPFAGVTEPVKVSGDELAEFIDRADFDGPLINYEKSGDQVEYLGSEEIDGAETHKVKVTKTNGNETVYLLDAERCLEIGAETTATAQGMELEITVTYGDYREIAGVMMAHSITQVAAGLPVSTSLTFDKIETNVDIAADRFAMPAVEPEAAPEAEKAAGE